MGKPTLYITLDHIEKMVPLGKAKSEKNIRPLAEDNSDKLLDTIKRKCSEHQVIVVGDIASASDVSQRVLTELRHNLGAGVVHIPPIVDDESILPAVDMHLATTIAYGLPTGQFEKSIVVWGGPYTLKILKPMARSCGVTLEVY